jgi:hypothetical protein
VMTKPTAKVITTGMRWAPSFYVDPPVPRTPPPEGRAYIETLDIRPSHVMARLQGWLVPGKWDIAEDCVQYLFITLWHSGRTLPTDRPLAMRILSKWARLRIMQNRARSQGWWARNVQSIPLHATTPIAEDRQILSRVEAMEYIAKAAPRHNAQVWAAAIIGENTLDDMEQAGHATSSSEALRRRNRALQAMRTAAGSTSTSKRVLVSASVSDEDFAAIAYACNRKAKAIAKRTGMAVRNVYSRMAKLGIERHNPPRNPLAIAALAQTRAVPGASNDSG